ncbi:hypothetical protein CARUB_v10001984mg [Capsella rubella]|uniref:Uncharacterized protein n=1 Tax=Capsella rubella TaxID=81985 RepID=R0HD06_9BRAS|nr:uncharacterized protein LOC17883918 [Capsella rubella]EOA21573.1 hypothetical protein CARUB_v10001984mg [Capsella rubella]
MLEFTDKGNINWLLKKQEMASSYYMGSEDVSRKRKSLDFLANDHELVKRSEATKFMDTSFDHKRRRFISEDSTNMNNNIEEGYYHHHHMSLDLELNLSPSLIDLNHHHDLSCNKNYVEVEKKKMTEKGTKKSLARVAFDLDEDCCDRGGVGGGSEEEMVARVCIKCHTLVMLCKASPACPNCKFMHSPEDTSLSLLFTPKPTLLA